MTKELIERSRKRHAFGELPLIALAVALVFSLVIAVTAVSVGVARAAMELGLGGIATTQSSAAGDDMVTGLGTPNVENLVKNVLLVRAVS